MKLAHRIPVPVLALVLFVLALLVRLWHIAATDIAGDEPFSIFVAQLAVADIVTYLGTGNNPPLFEILLHYYMQWVGHTDFLLRLLPAVLSALTVIPIVIIGERFLGKWTGVLGGLLFAFSTYNIRFAHEVRVYSLFSLLVACSIYFLLSILKDSKRCRVWIGLGITFVLLLYSHYLAVFVLVIQLILLLIYLPTQRWKQIGFLVASCTIAYSPNLMIFLNRVEFVGGTGGTWVPEPGWGEIYGSINLMLNDRIATLFVIVTVVVGILVGNRAALVTTISLQKLKYPLIVFLLFLVPYLTQFFVSKFYIPMFIDRYYLYCSVPLLLFVSWISVFVWSETRWKFVGSILVVIGALFTVDFNPSNHRDLKNAVNSVKDNMNADTEVYISPDFFVLGFAYHYNREWFEQIGTAADPNKPLIDLLNKNRIYPIGNSSGVNQNLAPRVIFFDAASTFVNPSNGILAKLNSEMSMSQSFHHPEIFDIYFFEEN